VERPSTGGVWRCLAAGRLASDERIVRVVLNKAVGLRWWYARVTRSSSPSRERGSPKSAMPADVKTSYGMWYASGCAGHVGDRRCASQSNWHSNALLEHVARGRLRPLLSAALFLEYEDTLKRPEIRLATDRSEEDVDGFLAALASAAEAVDVNFRWRPELSDPKDEVVLEAAVNGEADALVTHNLRDFEPAKRLFGLRVLLPRDVLKELRR
jgi:predicted nucleic acid-binding protein